jgi:hypothetical protein
VQKEGESEAPGTAASIQSKTSCFKQACICCSNTCQERTRLGAPSAMAARRPPKMPWRAAGSPIGRPGPPCQESPAATRQVGSSPRASRTFDRAPSSLQMAIMKPPPPPPPSETPWINSRPRCEVCACKGANLAKPTNFGTRRAPSLGLCHCLPGGCLLIYYRAHHHPLFSTSRRLKWMPAATAAAAAAAPPPPPPPKPRMRITQQIKGDRTVTTALDPC